MTLLEKFQQEKGVTTMDKYSFTVQEKVNQIGERWIDFYGSIEEEICLLLNMKVDLRNLEQTEYRDRKIEWCTKMVSELEKML